MAAERLPRRVGIALGDLVPREPTTLSAWSGKWIAFDAWNILYQFLSSVRQRDGTPLMNERGEVTSHLAGVLYRTSNLVEAGIKPVWVFDGKPHSLKLETLAARAERRRLAEEGRVAAVEAGDMETALSKAKQTSRMMAPMAEQAMQLLRALGLPVIEAPMDGEAQAAWMCAEGHVAAVCSQDFDSLLYGSPTTLRNVTVSGRRKVPGKQVWTDLAPEAVHLSAVEAATGLSRERLIDVALLVGTDFHPGVKGIGPKKALQLVLTNDGLEPLLERLAAHPDSAKSAAERVILEQHEALADRDAVRTIFLEPAHTDDFDLTLRRPDAAAVDALMVERYGFDAARVAPAVARFTTARGKQEQRTLF